LIRMYAGRRAASRRTRIETVMCWLWLHSPRHKPTCCIQENKDRNSLPLERREKSKARPTCCIQENKDRNHCALAGVRRPYRADVLHPGEQGSKRDVSSEAASFVPMTPTCCIQENKDRNRAFCNDYKDEILASRRAASRRTRIETRLPLGGVTWNYWPTCCIQENKDRNPLSRLRAAVAMETVPTCCIQENKDRN